MQQGEPLRRLQNTDYLSGLKGIAASSSGMISGIVKVVRASRGGFEPDTRTVIGDCRAL